LFSGTEIVHRLQNETILCEAIILGEPLHAESDAKSSDRVTRLRGDASSQEVLEAVRRLVRLKSSASDIVPAGATSLIARTGDLPLLPQLIVKLLGYLEMPLADVPVQDFVRDIEFDPRSTAALLQFANGARHGVRNRVANVFQAVSLVGIRRTIGVLLGISTRALQGKMLKSWTEAQRNRYYRRTAVIASMAGTLAQHRENTCRDTAFLLGLLQDVGVAVLCERFHRRYIPLLDRVMRIGHLSLAQLEQEEFGMTHAAVSAALLHHWQLPRSMVRLVAKHHDTVDPNDPQLTASEQGMLRCMQLSEAIADLFDAPHPRRLQSVHKLLGPAADNADMVRQLLELAVVDAEHAARLLEVRTPDLETLNTVLNACQVTPVTVPSDSQPAAAGSGLKSALDWCRKWS
jgi:HD-like signal output (HDOD) protein